MYIDCPARGCEQMKKNLIGLAVALGIFTAIVLAVVIFLRLLRPKRKEYDFYLPRVGTDFYLPKVRKDFYVPKVGRRFYVPKPPNR